MVAQANPVLGPLMHPLLFRIPTIETHHAAVIGVVATDIGNFIAIVNAWNTGGGHEEGHEPTHFPVPHVSIVLDVARPSSELGVLSRIQGAISQRGEARSVLVAGDVSHEVMGAVGADALIGNVNQCGDIG